MCCRGRAPARARAAHARTDANHATRLGCVSLCYLKGVGESVPRRGEGSGTGVAKRKAGVAKRRAQWVRSTLCACRLESPACLLESPVQRTEANGAGEAVDGDMLRVVGFAADLQAITATWWVATEANRLRYYLTVTGHGLRPWVGLQIQETGALAAPVTGAAYLLCMQWLFIQLVYKC